MDKFTIEHQLNFFNHKNIIFTNKSLQLIRRGYMVQEKLVINFLLLPGTSMEFVMLFTNRLFANISKVLFFIKILDTNADILCMI
jgi:hypothetical protein